MKLCLIIPPSIFLLDERVFPSLGILKVASSLESNGNFDIKLLDLSGISNFEYVVEEFVRYNSDVKWFGITATTPQMPAVHKIAKVIASVSPESMLCIGGPHPTLVLAAYKNEIKNNTLGRASRALNNLRNDFNIVVAGDGEYAILEAVKYDKNSFGIVIDADDPKSELFLSNKAYNETSYPARHLIDLNSYNYKIDGVKATSLIAQLGCPFECAFSVTGDTLIFTDNGFERIDSLAEGEGEIEKCAHGGVVNVYKLDRKVSTHDGICKTLSVVYEGNRQVFEVCTEYGFRLKGTAEHPFLSIENGEFVWKKLRDLKIDDWLVIKNPDHIWPNSYVKLNKPNLPIIPPGGFLRKEVNIPTELNEDLGWLVGFLIGDGCLPADKRPAVHFAVTDDIKESLCKIIKDNFNIELAINKASNTDKMENGWLHSRAVYEFFIQSLGIKSKDKLHVPIVILKSPRSVVEAFLKGLFDADGYNDKHGSYVTTISYDLAREISNLLLMLGEFPFINKVRSTGFVKVGFSAETQTGHAYRIGKLKIDKIPTERALYKSSKSGGWYWRTPRNKDSFEGVLRSTLRRSGLAHKFDISGYHYVKIKTISSGLVEDIYDLRVMNNHSFIANGIVVHNCGGRNSSMLRRIRTRTIDSIINEMKQLYNVYGYAGFMFYDDELNVNRDMVKLMDAITSLQESLNTQFCLRGFVKAELFTEMQARSMYRAGFRWLLTGFESGSSRILENINKKADVEDNNRCFDIARDNGLKIKALMSIGHAGESQATIAETGSWLLDRKPDDFDITIITTYPGTSYYDDATETSPGIWTYVCPKSGDRLHSYEVDYNKVADYYKGDPDGGYKSYVFTDYIDGDGLVRARDDLESSIRNTLGIKFNQAAPQVRYEHSMGQSGPLPSSILRSTVLDKDLV